MPFVLFLRAHTQHQKASSFYSRQQLKFSWYEKLEKTLSHMASLCLFCPPKVHHWATQTPSNREEKHHEDRERDGIWTQENHVKHERIKKMEPPREKLTLFPLILAAMLHLLKFNYFIMGVFVHKTQVFNGRLVRIKCIISSGCWPKALSFKNYGWHLSTSSRW